MPKRKRDDGDPDIRSDVKQRRIEHKLKLGATKLGHAFKIAKGFERQKLGRRRKTAAAQGDAKDVARIDSEIEASKILDTSASAQQHLFKTLLKTKAIADHPDLPQQVKQSVKASSNSATLNVIARICKSNQAQAALDAAVADIRQALGIKSDSAATLKKRRMRSKDFASTTSKDSTNHRQDPNPQTTAQSRPRPLAASPQLSGSDAEIDDLAAHEKRIASSRDGTEDEFSDAGALEQRLLNETAQSHSAPRSTKYDIEADLSISGSGSRSVSASPEPTKSATTKRTSFLPSLTMGGYISGSDSDVEDVDIAPKKNRRGQRARQQIWEQKYGNHAKHLQKQGYAPLWDPKRGAVDGSERQRGRFRRERRASPDYVIGGDVNAASVVSKRAKGIKKTHRDDGGALHPSWEAAKKAKERKEAPVAFQGKKITFD